MATSELYTTPDRVRRLLRLTNAFSSSTNPTDEQVDSLIDQKMSVLESEVDDSFHLAQANEYHNLDSTYVPQSGIRVFLRRKNIITPLATASGDSLKIWNGSTWEEWVGVKTESRAGDFWIDERLGILHILTAGFAPRYLGVDFTYRYNSGARTQINAVAGIDASVTSVTVDSTAGFPMQGWIRIDSEEMRYTGKTATTFTGLTRGDFNTTAATHADDAVIFYCPSDVVDVTTKLVAIDLLTSEDWSSGGMNSGENPSGQIPVSSKIENWKADVSHFFDRYRNMVVAIR